MGVMSDTFSEEVKKGKSIEQIAKEQDRDIETVISFLAQNSDRIEVKNFLIDYYNRFKIEDDKFMVISDTHLSGLYGSYKLLYLTYEFALKHNIKYIVHVGDIIEGTVHEGASRNYPLERQLEELEKYYPEVDGIKTFYINGNHDYLWLDNCDLYEVNKILDAKKNIICMGVLKAYLNLNDKHRILAYHSNQYGVRIPSLEYDLKLKGHGHSFYIKNEEQTIYLPSLCLGSNLKPDCASFLVFQADDTKYNIKKYRFTSKFQPFEEKQEKPLTLQYKKVMMDNERIYI